MERIKSDKIVLADSIFSGYIYIENGKIAAVTKGELPHSREYDLTGKFVSAGFIDVHTHGGGGFAFMESSPEMVVSGCNFHLAHGTTSILPTVSCAPIPTLERAVINIKAAMESPDTLPNIIGAHLEGPYLCAAQCGAQFPDFITPPKKDEYEPFFEKYKGTVARVTYAPENDKGGEFARYLKSLGIVTSAGHSDAKYGDILTAYENGMRLITHLYSCTSTVTRDRGFRTLGIIESAYLIDGIYAEIIADGRHLPPELIKLILKIKGSDRTVLCTDSLEIAGTDITEGVMSGTEFIVEDGVCKLRDRSAFAGSVATADRLVRVMTAEVGADISTAVKMITKNPADIMGLSHKGRLECGCDADIVAFDEGINITAVFVGGVRRK